MKKFEAVLDANDMSVICKFLSCADEPYKWDALFKVLDTFFRTNRPNGREARAPTLNAMDRISYASNEAERAQRQLYSGPDRRFQLIMYGHASASEPRISVTFRNPLYITELLTASNAERVRPIVMNGSYKTAKGAHVTFEVAMNSWLSGSIGHKLIAMIGAYRPRLLIRVDDQNAVAGQLAAAILLYATGDLEGAGMVWDRALESGK